MDAKQSNLKLSNKKTTVPRKQSKHVETPCAHHVEFCDKRVYCRCQDAVHVQVHLQIEDLRLKKLTPHVKWLLIYKKKLENLRIIAPRVKKAWSFNTSNTWIVPSIAPPVKHPEQSDHCQPCRLRTSNSRLSIRWSPPETCMSFISVSITNSISKIDIAVDFSNIAQRDTSSWKIHRNRLQQSKHIFWWHWFFNGVHIWWSWRAAEPVIQ